MASYVGSGGDDTQTGTAGEDTFDYSQGGHDTLFGGDDDDFFEMGASLDPLDVIDGGDQTNLDGVGISGDYSAGLTLTAAMLPNIEGIGLGAGAYRLTLADGVAHGHCPITVQWGATGVFDASAVTANPLSFTLNDGATMRIVGGAGDDLFQLYSADRANVLIGGPGQDELYAEYTQSFHAAGHSFRGFETLRVFTGSSIVLADGNVAAGETLTINAFFSVPIDVDGHKEMDGRFAMTGDILADHMVGGHLADTLAGGAGADTLSGGGGADELTGGADADVFAFSSVHQSWSDAPDLITDLQAGDSIDLSAIDADRKTPGDQAFTLVDHFGGHAGELTLTYDADDDVTVLSGDVNGDGVADLVVRLAGDQTGFAGFVL